MQKIVASFLMAILVCTFMATASLMLSYRASLIISLIAAFGTPIWSSASRTMWSHTWEITLTGCAVLILLRAAEHRGQMHSAMLATVMAWSFFVRPTGALPILGVTIYMMVNYRRELLAYVVAGIVWLGGFVGYFWATYGQLIPDYYRQGSSLQARAFAAGLAGVLISPSRGLFIFVPIAIVPIYLVLRYWRYLSHKPLARMSAGIIIGNIAIVASWLVWWGGWSVGPRLLTDTIPWFVLLAILGWKALESCAGRVNAESSMPRGFLGAVAVLATVSVAINGWCAISNDPMAWNPRVDVDRHPGQLWDWRSPQFLEGIINSEARTTDW